MILRTPTQRSAVQDAPLSDTSDDARRAQEAAWRRLGPEGRVRLMAEMSDDLRAVALAGIRARQSGLTDEEARGALLRLVLGDALYEAAYLARGRTA